MFRRNINDCKKEIVYTQFRVVSHKMYSIISGVLCVVIFTFGCSFSLPAQVCGGSEILFAGFDQGIPQDWTVVPVDNQAVYPTLISRGLKGKWQSYDRAGQKCVANASRNLSFSVATNDWLISPAVVLPIDKPNICLSWKTSTAGKNYKESFELRVSNTGASLGNFDDLLLNQPSFGNDEWVNHSVDLSKYAGQKIHFAFHHNSTYGSFALFIDEVKISFPQSKDLGIVGSNSETVSASSLCTLNVSVQNYGLQNVPSCELQWTLDGVLQPNIKVSQTLSKGAIVPLSLPTSTVIKNGLHHVKVWTMMPNNEDQYRENDTLGLTLFAGTKSKNVMIEEFTQASCPPCADQNPGFNATISPYLFDERAAALKFHTAWPGFDPMYEHDSISSQTRVLHYAVFGVPQALLNGKAYAENCSWPGQPSCIKDDLLARLAKEKTIFDLDATHSLSGNKINVSLNISAETDMPLNDLRLFGYLMEDKIVYDKPPGSNGEFSFSQVVRRSLTPQHGMPISKFEALESRLFNFDTGVHPEWDVSQMRAVFFIQQDVSQKIWQSTTSKMITPTIGPNGHEDALWVFPTVTSDQVSVRILGDDTPKTIDLLNAYGNVVHQMRLDPQAGTAEQLLYLGAWPSGIYWIRLSGSHRTYPSKRIIKM
jgi:hypothetical protein